MVSVGYERAYLTMYPPTPRTAKGIGSLFSFSSCQKEMLKIGQN